MTSEGLTWIVVVNGVVQLAGLILLAFVLVRGHREIARITRAVAGLVYQENEKTRARIEEALGRLSR
jgi:hypothetical protein